jgi:phage terminase large subunit GpA-like protein
MISSLEFLRLCNDRKPTENPPHLISEYIQGRRIMPPGSPKPGPMNLHLTPYVFEIIDSAGPYSGINRISVLKGVQIALTTALESIIAYYMDANPAEIMYCTATEALIRKWLKRLEMLIETCGYRDKISNQTEKSKSRKSGDTDFSKEYPGGSLTMASLGSPASMRSESNRILCVDEVDAAKKEVVTGEGNFLGLLDGRTAAYAGAWKVINTSTPSTYEKSVIWPEFLSGDQRYYNVPCLLCGSYFVFDFKYFVPVNDKHGYLERVFHECPHCNKEIWNHNKTEMMRLDHAEWRPTAIPQDKTHRSYQISGLYSPFASWERVYRTWLKAEEDPTLKPSFRNLWEGLPYKEQGHRPDIQKVIKLRGDYKNGSVPNGVLYLTCASDVQRGAEKYQKMTPDELDLEIKRIRATGGNLALWKARLPRIETEVMGVGQYHKTWSIDYKVFYGHTTLGSYAGAFEKIDQWSADGGMNYKRGDGVVFAPVIALMDCSDGDTRASVFDLCSRWRNTFPNRNYGWLKQKKDPGMDESSGRNFDRFQKSKGANDVSPYIQISTNYYKGRLYSALNIPRDPLKNNQAPGFCEFPVDRPDHYFKMLTGAEALSDGSFSEGGRPVEALDCRVYNLCAADVWLEDQVRQERDRWKKKGISEAQIKLIDKPWFLKDMDKRINQG